MSEEFRGDNLIIFQSYPLLCLRWFVPCSFVQPNPETEMCLSSELCHGDHRSVFSDGVLFFCNSLISPGGNDVARALPFSSLRSGLHSLYCRVPAG